MGLLGAQEGHAIILTAVQFAGIEQTRLFREI